MSRPQPSVPATAVPFFKLSGAGNDFIALVEPETVPHSSVIEGWCRRGLSLGADGLFTLERVSDGVRMVHFNADGGRSDLCLNGSRCAAQLAFHLGWGSGDHLTLITDAAPLAARQLDPRRVELTLPEGPGAPHPQTLTVDGSEYTGWSVDVGVPHFVLPWDRGPLADAPVAELGPPLRRHADLGPAGANVHFVRFVDGGRFEIRSFERGVEAETLACGTGAVATAAAGLAAGRVTIPAVAHTAGGFVLGVDGTVVGDGGADGRLGETRLSGDARLVARGELLDGAL